MLWWVWTLVYWSFVTTAAIALFPIAVTIFVVTIPFDRRRIWLHQFTCFWASLYTWFNPFWPVTVVGREKIDRDKSYVMVANHLSLVDIFALFRLFVHFKWVSKVEVFRIPCIGWNMALNGYIRLRRGDKQSILRMFDACEHELRRGSSVMLFPEGTRSRDGKLRPFKPGAFDLALRTGKPILPILVEGTFGALPAKGFRLHGRHKITITVLDELPAGSFAGEDKEALTERVRSIFEERLQ